jgi:hypothetical protein
MQLWNWHRRGATRYRRITVAVMLCAYLVTGFGTPVIARVDKSGEPFPCQGHACGCQTADQCWGDCCCYSNAQKLAWAKDRGVRPPSYVARQAATEAESELAESDCCKSRKSCETRGATAACCDKDSAHRGHSCHEPSGESIESHLVLSFTASKCRSIATLWCVLGGDMPPVVIDWQFEWNSVGWLRTWPAALNSLDRVPPVPPPRV